MLADRLKMTLEQVCQLSVLEIHLWAGYFDWENQQARKTMNAHGNRKL